MDSLITLHPLSWHSPSENYYTRPFDPLEKYEYFMTTMNPTNPQRAVVVGVTLSSSSSSSLSPTSLKSAWKSLRYAHPILGCNIHPKGFDFHVQSPSQIDEWVDSTFFIISDNNTRGVISARDLSSKLRCPKTAELYYLPSTNEIFLQIRHEIIDGIGSFMLLNNLLKLLRSPHSQSSSSSTLVDNPALLSPSMSEITKTPTTSSPQLTQKTLQMFQKYISSPPLSLPTKPTFSTYESHRHEHIFTSSQTNILLQRCKSTGITITHAITASIALSILKITGTKSGDFTTSLPISLRDTFPAPYNSDAHACLFCITAPLPVIPVDTATTTFEELARTVKAVYSDWKGYEDNVASHAAQAKIFEDLVEAGVIGQSNFAGKATVVMSSLGIVEKYLTVAKDVEEVEGEEGEKGIKVEDFWMGQITGNTKIILFLYTFAGKIRLVACYNRRFHDDAAVAGFVDVLVQQVYDGLGIDINDVL